MQKGNRLLAGFEIRNRSFVYDLPIFEGSALPKWGGLEDVPVQRQILHFFVLFTVHELRRLMPEATHDRHPTARILRLKYALSVGGIRAAGHIVVHRVLPDEVGRRGRRVERSVAGIRSGNVDVAV